MDQQLHEWLLAYQADELTPEQVTQLEALLAEHVTANDALKTAIVTLRQWADDAEATTATAGNAVAVLNVVLDRLGIFFDRFADLLIVLGKNR